MFDLPTGNDGCHSSGLLKLGDVFANHLWDFLNLRDILQFSAVCKMAECMEISGELAAKVLRHHKNFICKDHERNISLQKSMNIAGLRKAVYRTPAGETMSAFFDVFEKYSFEISCFTPPLSKLLLDEEILLSHELEKTSFDEFDDFVSRHPNPKQRNSHNRGDSLFNSDIEQIAEAARCAESSNMGMLVSLALGSDDVAPDVSRPKRHQRVRTNVT